LAVPATELPNRGQQRIQDRSDVRAAAIWEQQRHGPRGEGYFEKILNILKKSFGEGFFSRRLRAGFAARPMSLLLPDRRSLHIASVLKSLLPSTHCCHHIAAAPKSLLLPHRRTHHLPNP